jgi:hypothetical protein
VPATPEALLALIVSDPDAIVALAAWGALDLRLTAAELDATHQQVGDLTGLGPVRAARAFRKLAAARVLTDGGITELADKLLQQHVRQHVTARPRAARRPR